jgi:hypothetical protein
MVLCFAFRRNPPIWDLGWFFRVMTIGKAGYSLLLHIARGRGKD